MRIPLVDLKAQYASIRGEIDETVRVVIESAVFVGGPQVEAFESAFASFCGAGHAVGVANGTDALALALRASGVGPGDEVVTVPNTFVATAEAIGLAGARVVFADIDPATFTISPAALEEAITPRTRAVLPVHLYGRMADMDPILSIARRRDLIVIEDACQAHGALYRGRRAGTLGLAAAFSFYPGKNLGAYGDGGAVVTNDARLARRLRMLRNHGRTAKYDHEMEGVNSRLDTLQAAVLSVKLSHLERWNATRRELAALYDEQLGGVEEVVRPAPGGPGHVHHLYVVRARRRDELLRALRDSGIDAGVHYPIPLHRLGAYSRLGLPSGTFPAAEKACKEVVSLPIHPAMSREDVRAVCLAVKTFYAQVPA